MGFKFRQRIVGTRIKLIHNCLYKLAQNSGDYEWSEKICLAIQTNCFTINVGPEKRFEPLTRITLASSLGWSHLELLIHMV